MKSEYLLLCLREPDTGVCPALKENVSFPHSQFVLNLPLLLLLLLLLLFHLYLAYQSGLFTSGLSAKCAYFWYLPCRITQSVVHTSVYTKTKLPTVKGLVNWDTRLLSSKNRNPNLRLYIELKNVLKQKSGLQTFFLLQVESKFSKNKFSLRVLSFSFTVFCCGCLKRVWHYESSWALALWWDGEGRLSGHQVVIYLWMEVLKGITRTASKT